MRRLERGLRRAAYSGASVITRRRFLSAAALPTLLPGAPAFGSAADDYASAVARTWRADADGIGERSAVLREIVRLATLAPSSHNTQCWRFVATATGIAVHPDFTRRCPAVDPDDHHLFVSLGCAVENLALAAGAHGFAPSVRFVSASGDTIAVDLDATATRTAQRTARFLAITERQCTRAPFDGQALTTDELRQLSEAGTGAGVHVLLLTDRPAIERVVSWVIEANDAQMRDAAFERELKHWIRFDDAEAVRTGDGLSTRTTGNPSVPRWIGGPLLDLFYRPKNEADKYAAQLRSSAGVAVFVSDASDPVGNKAGWMEAGRCYERFALQATAMGIRNAFVNQPVEVAALRPRFADAFGLGGHRPELIARFGRGPLMPRSLRRPLDAVLT
jgi:hypothetical protein